MAKSKDDKEAEYPYAPAPATIVTPVSGSEPANVVEVEVTENVDVQKPAAASQSSSQSK